ncbi:hypothetical protein ABT061_28780 [Streptosporangium sp. NPDC002544]
MAFNGTPRPSPRRHHARTELDDFAIALVLDSPVHSGPAKLSTAT